MTNAPGEPTQAPRLPVALMITTSLLTGAPLLVLRGSVATWFALLASTAAAYSAAGGALCAAIRVTGRVRGGWLLLGLGALGWAAGNTYWSYNELVMHREVLFPGPSDYGFLLFPLAGTAGLWLLASSTARPGSRVSSLLDGLIFTGSLLSISWATILRTTYRAGGDSPLAFVVSMAYPCSDLVLGTMVFLLATRAKRGRRAVIGLIVLGLIAMALADTLFAISQAKGDYVSGQLSDAGWIVGFTALALAGVGMARTPVEIDEAGEQRRWQMVLPYLPFAITLATGSLAILRGHTLDTFAIVVAEVVFLFVVIRQMLTLFDNRALTDQIRHQAFHDPLTGLANRSLFTDRLQHALALRQRGRHELVVICVDLSNFAQVNDTLGHEAGDALLQGVADRLRTCFRPSDTIARLGGDEFGVIIEGTMRPEGEAQRVLDRLLAPFPLRTGSFTPGVSVGVAATRPLAAGTTLTPGELMKQVDLALAAAKSQGPNDYAVFEPVMSHNFDEEMSLRRELARALDDGGLSVVHQPIHELSGRRIVGVEALARWTDGTLGVVTPATFIPVAERAHLIAPIGEFVLDRACQEFSRWNAGGDRYLSVNVSPLQLLEPGFPQLAAVTAARHGLSPAQLVLEVTETALAEESEIAPALGLLRELGFRIAIDDFGTGYASLRYLQHFPVDVIKIDRSYVTDIEHDPEAAKLLCALLQMVYTLGLTCIAEGIETENQARRLAEAGCRFGQGFLFSRPGPLHLITDVPVSTPAGQA